MFKKFKNPLKKYGLKGRDNKTNYIYTTLQYGDTEELPREAKRLNKMTKKIGVEDRKYFVWPVAGPINHAILVVGRTV